MTQVERTRLKSAYRGVIYGIDVLDHLTGQVVRNDYVGKTRQPGRGRENQHRDDQPWSDLIVGSSHVLWEGICTEDELNEMERRYIQDVEQRPRLNWKLNEDNPRHIPKWVLLEQRHERDDAAGRSRWVPPEQRSRTSLLEWDTPNRPAFERPAVRQRPLGWRPWQKRLTGWGCTWSGSTIVGWLTALHYHLGGWKQTGLDSAITATLLMVWVMCGAPIPVGKWARRARRLRRRLWR